MAPRKNKTTPTSSEADTGAQTTTDYETAELLDNAASSRGSSSRTGAQEPTVILPTTGYVSNFDPERDDQTIERWIHKLEAARNVFQWSERFLILQAVNRLQGLAKDWLDALPTIELSWAELKQKLLEEFSSYANYASAMRMMLGRVKRPDETYRRYYYEKMNLIRAVDLQGEKAVSCLIDGIGNENIRTSANAREYKSPEPLLQFLKRQEASTLNQSSTSTHSGKSTTSSRPLPGPVKNTFREAPYAKAPGKCFNCGKPGHRAAQCRRPKIAMDSDNRLPRCKKCQRFGHNADACRARNQSQSVL